MRRNKKLTSVQVNALRAPGYFGDGAGLYLQVSATGTKSWLFRFMRAGKAREMGLGSLHTVSLADARKAAAAARMALLAGVDPIEERNRTRALAQAHESLPFHDCARRYVEAHRAGWRNVKHAEQWVSTLETYAVPVLGALPVDRIESADVMRVLQPIWTTKAETATRLRGRIEAVLDWASAMKYRTGENPAKWRGNLANLLPNVSRTKRVTHFRALPFAEIGALVGDLRKLQGASALALEFAILTAARTGEVLGATWAEIDLEQALWTIPGERMKAGQEQRVPLSKPAMAVLRKIATVRTGDYVFPGGKQGRPLSSMALLMTLRRMNRGDLTVHGFRSTFRDWAAETTAYPRDVVEMALAHVIANKVEAAYRRGDLLEKRRDLMNEWARRCKTPTVPAKVIPLRRGA